MINKKLKVGNVPNLRFPGFERIWIQRNLGEISSMQAGKFISASEIRQSSQTGLFPCYGGNGLRGYVKSFNQAGEYPLIGRQGALCGNVMLAKGKFHATEHAVVVKSNEDVDTSWLYYLLIRLNLNQYATGAAQPGLSVQNLEQVEFRMPESEKEQKKISSFLAMIDERIQTQNKIIEQLETLIQELRIQIFKGKRRFTDIHGRDFSDWKKVRIGDILKIGNGKDYKHLQSGEIPVFGTGGFMTLVNDYLYDGETVCIGRKGTIDKPMYHEGKLWTVDTLFYTHSFQSCIPKFIFYLFQTINWLEYNEASGVPSLSKTTIEKIGLQIPSIEEQERIASFLSKVDHKIQTEKTILEQLEMQKKYLLQQMFV